MHSSQIPLFPPRTLEELVADIKILTTEIQDLYCQDQIPWVIGYSGGKDSSSILQLVWNAIAQLPIEKRQIYICYYHRYLSRKSFSSSLGKKLFEANRNSRLRTTNAL